MTSCLVHAVLTTSELIVTSFGEPDSSPVKFKGKFSLMVFQ